MPQELLKHSGVGLLFVLSAPAGTGKTTLVRMLQKEFVHIAESVSFTTRAPRGKERGGEDYYFVTQEAFEAKIASGEFLEYAKVFDHYYGTSKRYVEQLLTAGKYVFLVIDTQGAMRLKGVIDAVFIFLLPPSLEELKARMCARRTDSEESMVTRLSWATQELALADRYEYQIINEDLEVAYQILRSIVIAEGHKTAYLCNKQGRLSDGTKKPTHK